MTNNKDFIATTTGGFTSLHSRGEDPTIQIKPTEEKKPAFAKASPKFKPVKEKDKKLDLEEEKKVIAQNTIQGSGINRDI